MTSLRVITLADVEELEKSLTLTGEYAGDFQQFGLRDHGWLRREVEAGETLRRDRGRLAVLDDDDRLAGEVSWIRRDWGPPPYAWCWMTGIMLLPQSRGRGIGATAQRLLAEYLFAHTTAERIEASTASDNVAEQRALERAGFALEGVMRRAQWRDGAWRDEVLFSKLRGEL